MSEEITSERFFQRLEALASPPGREVIRRYRESGKGWRGKDDIAISLRMAQVFALAKEFVDMPPAEIERLLESPIHEVRVGALSIMDKQARKQQDARSSQEAAVRSLPEAHGQDQFLGPG